MSTSHQSLNLQTPVEPQQGSTQSDDAHVAAMNDYLEQVRADVQRTRRQVDRHLTEYESHVRRVKTLWAVVIVCFVSLIGAAWFSFGYFQKNRDLLANMPVLQGAMDTLSERVGSAEQKLVQDAGFTDRMAKLEQNVSSNFRDIRNQTQSLATQMGQRIKTEVNQGLQALQNRISGVESNQREAADHAVKLETEIATLRREMASMQEQAEQQAEQQLSQAQELRQAQQGAATELSDVRRRLETSTNKLDAVVDHVNVQRTEFDIARNRTQEIAPSIYLTVRQIDVAQQRVDGWLQLASEGRVVWIRGNGAQNPLRFVTKQEQRAHEVVFTRIQADHVTGYVLAPAPESSASLMTH